MGSKKTFLERCNPNRHGEVRLVFYEETAPEGHADDPEFEPESIYVVESPGYGYSPDGGAEFLNEVDGRAEYDREVKRLSEEPNWEAQAEYDEQHGTVNGYAPWQFQREC